MLFRSVWEEGQRGIPQQSALWAICVTSHFMELWATLFAGCGKAAFTFPYAVNSAVHGGMGSYAQVHNASGIVKKKRRIFRLCRIAAGEFSFCYI